ncbi:hypothetical protein CCHOA_04030 [Corynebacterium choanae]|uniref:Uncharacterized protein n=1 Tax=Corynebacterium choanae TaxID=1862358 RepID=A0A3G6J540_9CORY|nr:hypothetical protein CCHOA_04030 [Corynebacterium choanae]
MLQKRGQGSRPLVFLQRKTQSFQDLLHQVLLHLARRYDLEVVYGVSLQHRLLGAMTCSISFGGLNSAANAVPDADCVYCSCPADCPWVSPVPGFIAGLGIPRKIYHSDARRRCLTVIEVPCVLFLALCCPWFVAGVDCLFAQQMCSVEGGCTQGARINSLLPWRKMEAQPVGR